MKNLSKVIIDLDFSSTREAVSVVEKLDPSTCRLRVGKLLFLVGGPSFVKILVNRGFDVFLDIALSDTPDIVGQAVKAVADMRVWMLSLQVSGGSKMMKSAVKALGGCNYKPLLVAETLSSSIKEEGLKELGLHYTPKEYMLYLTDLVKVSGLNGVICGGHQILSVKEQFGPDFLTVVSDVRPHRRDEEYLVSVVSPVNAFTLGADYIIVGEPIRSLDDVAQIISGINLCIFKH